MGCCRKISMDIYPEDKKPAVLGVGHGESISAVVLLLLREHAPVHSRQWSAWGKEVWCNMCRPRPSIGAFRTRALTGVGWETCYRCHIPWHLREMVLATVLQKTEGPVRFHSSLRRAAYVENGEELTQSRRSFQIKQPKHQRAGGGSPSKMCCCHPTSDLL